MKRASSLLILLFLLILPVFCVGCDEEKAITGPDDFYVYFMDNSKKELVSMKSVIDMNLDVDTLIWSIWNHMVQGAKGESYISVVPENLDLLKYEIKGSDLTLFFPETYYEMTSISEVLFRAAVVKTFTQLKNVSTVEFKINEQPLMNNRGQAVGTMKNDDFVDVIGNGINVYVKAPVRLYFTDRSGKALFTVEHDEIYKKSMPMEEVVMGLLLKGPEEEDSARGYMRTLPEGVELLSVSTNDGICSVNFNDAFLEGLPNVEPSVIVYSIVNTLTELPEIKSVQISVNGSSKIEFMDEISLKNPLSRDLDYVKGEVEN